MFNTKLKAVTSPRFPDFDKEMRVFDDMFESMFASTMKGFAFPPTNLEKTQDGYIIEMALAGYKREDISVFQEGNVLEISANKQEKDGEMVYRGIRARSFTKQFILDNNAEVTDVSLTDGMLTVIIKQANPKPKRLEFKVN